MANTEATHWSLLDRAFRALEQADHDEGIACRRYFGVKHHEDLRSSARWRPEFVRRAAKTLRNHPDVVARYALAGLLAEADRYEEADRLALLERHEHTGYQVVRRVNLPRGAYTYDIVSPRNALFRDRAAAEALCAASGPGCEVKAVCTLDMGRDHYRITD